MSEAQEGGYAEGFLKGIVNVLTGGAAVVDEQLKAAERRASEDAEDAC